MKIYASTLSVFYRLQCEAFGMHEEDPVLQAADAMLAEIEQESEATLINSCYQPCACFKCSSTSKIIMRNLITLLLTNDYAMTTNSTINICFHIITTTTDCYYYYYYYYYNSCYHRYYYYYYYYYYYCCCCYYYYYYYYCYYY